MRRQIITIPNSPADFFISYRPRDLIMGAHSGDFNSCETALVEGSNMIILSGDFKKEVRKIIAANRKDSRGKLYEFFQEKSIEWASSWSPESKISSWVISRGER